MPATSFGGLSDISSEKLLINTRRPHGKSVRVKKVAYEQALIQFRIVHLLYLAQDMQASLTVRHLARVIGVGESVADVESILYRSAKDEVENGNGSPHTQSSDFNTIVFKYPAIFTIVIDEVDWELYFPAPKKEGDLITDQTHDPVIFIGEKTVILEADDEGDSVVTKTQKFDENHAFCNATSIEIEGMSAVRMFNLFTYMDGSEIQGTEKYGFEIYLRAPCANSDHRTTIIIDPDGQNQGPPEAPLMDA